MTRTMAREIAIQLDFSIAQNGGDVSMTLDDFFDREYYATLAGEDELYAEYPSKKQLEYIRTVVMGTFEHKTELDGYIEKYSRGWKLSRISHIAAAVMRTAMFEVLYMEDIPDSVAINEAVELSKGYEDPETVAFINGILGGFMRGERGDAIPDAKDQE